MAWKHTPRQLICALILTVPFAVICRPVGAAVFANGSTSLNPTDDNANPVIGVNDIGRMTITAPNGVISTTAILGDQPTGIGLVTVSDFSNSTGTGGTWTAISLVVGNQGTGRLEILNGGVVAVDFPSNPGAGDVTIGLAANSVGTVIVSGVGSLLRMGDDTAVGASGTGTLRIENEGFVNATNGLTVPGDTDTFTIGVLGRVELAADGRLRTLTFTNNGVIGGDGRIDSTNAIANSTTGHITAEAGDRLVVNALVTNQGEIAADGGQIEFFKAVTSTNAGADVTLRDGGRVTFPVTGFGYDSTAGTLSSVTGVNDVYGTVRLQGATSKIVVAGESTVVFHDAVTNAGGVINVFPGSTAVYLGGLTTTGSGAVLSIYLADPDADTGLGQVEVNGTAQLAGNLAINLASGFVPNAGDTFQLLTAGSVTGTLDLEAAPPLPGGMIWDIDVNATNVMLSVLATGDYNANGVVDTADYTLWRDTLGATGTGLAADGNGNGVVDEGDYLFWRSRFGNIVTGSGAFANASSAGAVPEPGRAILVFVGVIGVFVRQAAGQPKMGKCEDVTIRE